MHGMQGLWVALGVVTLLVSMLLARWDLENVCSHVRYLNPTFCPSRLALGGQRKHFPNELIGLIDKLVRIPSVSGTEQDIAKYIHAWLEKRGLNSTLQKVKPLCKECAPRFNVLAHDTHVQVEDVEIILSSHFDTVPGGPDANINTSEKYIFGRGVVDAKSIVAAMMLAAVDIIKDRRVALLFVCGEETDHGGMKAASSIGFSPNVTLINGEPTESKLCTYQKGMLKMRLSAVGIACHSGYPYLGQSAILSMIDALVDLNKTVWPGPKDNPTTMNIGKFSGGEAANIVPSSASAVIMFRLANDPETIEKAVAEVLGQHSDVSAQVLTGNPPIQFYVPRKQGQRFGTTAVSYNTDVAYFRRPIKRAVLFGAGSITSAHTDNEHIGVDELISLPEKYADIVMEILDE